MKYYFLIILACFVNISIVGAESNSPSSFDCSKAKGFVETKICTNAYLAGKDQVLSHLYNRVLKHYSWQEKNQNWWLLTRNACETEQCIEMMYQLRIKELNDDIHNRETYLKKCGGATERCHLEKLLWLGNFEGRRVFYERRRKILCYKGCGDYWNEHAIYEVEDGKIIQDTMWVGTIEKLQVEKHFPFAKSPELLQEHSYELFSATPFSDNHTPPGEFISRTQPPTIYIETPYNVKGMGRTSARNNTIIVRTQNGWEAHKLEQD